MRKIKFFALTLIIACVMCMCTLAADFVKSKTYENSFTDVKEASWYAKNVASVYELGLMDGVTNERFDTESEMSVAQAITIASRLHSIYNDKEIPESENGARWFQKYVDYAIANGIMEDGQFNSYTRSVLSYEMVMLFAAALPSEHYDAINNITYISDVTDNLVFHDDVFMFYNAGILNGNDSTGTFLPMSAITRKRAAVILSRTALKEDRIKFTLSEKKDSYTGKEVLEMIDKQAIEDTLDTIIVANAGDYKVSAGEYRYYSSVEGGDEAKIENEITKSAALYSLIINDNFKITYEEFAQVLVVYYNARISNYGALGYFDALDNQKLTDKVYAKLSAMDCLVYYLILNETKSMTPDKVYDFALANDYICAKHILIQKTTDDAYRKALEINLKLLDGADFDELLKENGEDPGMTARQYGYFFNKGQMVAPFEEAAYALEENALSGIVETSYGYHIIKRMPMDKEQFALSPDYANIVYSASSSSFNSKLASAGNDVKIAYIEKIDDIAEILK